MLRFQYIIRPVVTPRLLLSDTRTGWAFTSVLMSMLFQLYHYWFWILCLQYNSIYITVIFNCTSGAKQTDWVCHLLLSSCQSLSLDHWSLHRTPLGSASLYRLTSSSPPCISCSVHREAGTTGVIRWRSQCWWMLMRPLQRGYDTFGHKPSHLWCFRLQRGAQIWAHRGTEV